MITVFANPTINVGNDTTICLGSSAQLNATGGTTYNWSPATGLSSPTVSNPLASPTTTTNYIVTVNDANGCMASDFITVSVNPLPVVDAGVDQTICSGASYIPNATGGISYLWDNGAVQGVPVYPSSTTNYTVIVTDANGCENTDSVTVTVSCFGANDGTINMNATGGSSGFSYLWSNSSTTMNQSGLSTGTYSVTATDVNGCFATDSVIINETSPTGVIKGIVNFQSAHVTVGEVELIKKNGNTPADIIPLSNLQMDTSGTFLFSNLYPGNYILKALGDTNLYNNTSTYATNTNQWLLATEYYTSGCSGDTVSGITIDLIELPNNSGPGTINGRLVEGSGLFNKASGEPLGDIDITVDQSPGGTIMAATTTDTLGYFTVNNLPIGTYTIYADMNGYGVTLQTIDINATTPLYDVVL